MIYEANNDFSFDSLVLLNLNDVVKQIFESKEDSSEHIKEAPEASEAREALEAPVKVQCVQTTKD